MSGALKIGVNLLWLVPGRVGGSEEYVVRTLRAFAEAEPTAVLHLFVVSGFAAAHPELAALSTLHVVPLSGSNRITRVVAEATWLRLKVRQSRVSVVHHSGGTAPRVGRLPIVLTIHDVQFTRYPDTFSAVKLRWLRHAVPRAVRRARVILVPSGFVAASLDAFQPFSAQRVVLANTAPAASSRPTRPLTMRTRYGLPGPVLVYPAITYRHKNHRVVLEATARLLADFPDLRLMLTGRRGPHDAEVAADISRLGLDGVVVRPGRISAEDLDGLYELAGALVFPSRYEGFGIPVLEAMVRGCPVIAANTTALPEVVGDAGVLVDPDDVEAWVAAIARVLTDDQFAADLRRRGFAQSAAFSAPRSAQTLASAYRGALASAEPTS